MEEDAMEWETDGAPVDQDRLRKAREQAKAFVAGGRAEPHVKGPRLFSDQEAKQILDRTIRMAADGKINDDNAFSLDGIDALVHLVLAAKRCGTAEGHFQQSGMGLSGGVALYGKRVDALYKVMYKQLSGKEPVDEDEEAAGAAGDDSQDPDGGAGEAGADATQAGDGSKAKQKKRSTHASADPSSTILEDKELRSRPKELSFDSDPSFTRTSRLIDDNSPAGLLLHNLPVLDGPHIAFNANIKPNAVLSREQPANPKTGGDVTVDLRLVPSALQLLQAAATAPISPGIGQLYGKLQVQPEQLPGLKELALLDVGRILQDAIAAIPKSRTSAVQNAALAHAVRQVEDAAAQAQAEAAAAARAAQQQPSQSQRSGVGAPGGYDDDRMDVDQDQDAAPHDSGGWSGGDGGGGGSPYGEGEGMAGGEDDGEVYGSPVGFSLDERSGAEGGGGFGGEEEEERGAFGGLGDEEEGGGWQQPEEEEKLLGSDDEDGGMASLFSGRLGSSGNTAWGLGGSRLRWVSKARRAPAAAAAAAGAKTRTRRVKAEEPFPDLYTTPAPTLVPKSEFCYKTARRADARDKVLMPRDEGVRAKDMYSLFSHAPYRTNAAALASPATGRGQGGKGEEEGDVHSVWMALLRGRVLRAGKRKEQQQAAKAAAQAAGGGQQGGAAARPTASTTGPAESALGGDDDGAPYFNGADGGGDTFDHHDDDAGAYDAGGGASGSYDSFTHGDDDDGGYAGEGCGYGGGGDSRDIGVDPRTATFRQLLQPPRRVQRVTVKFDKSAGLADVRALKENLHSSLRSLAGRATDANRRQSAPAPPPLTFQGLLDQLSAAPDPAANPATTPGRAPPPAPAPAASLSGVTPHLAFICLLHLANEHGLALSNGGTLDSLVVTGLGQLAVS